MAAPVTWDWLAARRRRQLVGEDRAGYEARPVQPNEFEGLIAAQVLDTPQPQDPGDGGAW